MRTGLHSLLLGIDFYMPMNARRFVLDLLEHSAHANRSMFA